MDLNELTPELFEKAEFAERRRGYDMDQVDRFLEETGTAVAQLLVKTRQLEERAAHAESRLAEASRTEASRAEATAPPAAAPAPAPARPGTMSEEEEIERATRTLVMARRTADATVAEAEAEAGTITAEARANAEGILSTARAEVEAERIEATSDIREIVLRLEARRDALAELVDRFEAHLEGYRERLTGVAESITSLVDDPRALATESRPDTPDEASGHTESTPGAAPRGDAAPSQGDPAGSAGEMPSDAEQASLDLTDATQAHDTVAEVREDGEWGRGSWSQVADGPDGPDEARGSTPASEQPEVVGTETGAVRPGSVVVDAEPVTGQTNDRFLRELDEAVNETPGDDAMSAFFEGGEESERGRFGWRR